MQRRWKLYGALIVLAAIFAFIFWNIYMDYQLRAYPQQIADSIPLPTGVHQVKEETVFVKECSSTHIYRYYATDLTWDTIMRFYGSYAQTSFWMPKGNEVDYFHRFNSQEIIYFFVDRIHEYSSDSDLASLAKEQTVYVIQVSYQQNERLFDTVCKSED